MGVAMTRLLAKASVSPTREGAWEEREPGRGGGQGLPSTGASCLTHMLGVRWGPA